MIAIDGNQIVATTLGLAAIIISGGSLVLTARISNRKTNDEYTQSLEMRIERQDHEIDELKAEQIQQARELEQCKLAREELQRQNFGLLTKLYTIEQEQRRQQ